METLFWIPKFGTGWIVSSLDMITGLKNLDDVLGAHLQTDPGNSTKTPIAPRVRIDNEIASQCTVIEVQAGDNMGLGFRLASVIANLGLNILSAKLATEKGYAFDVFYVQSKEGEKITSSFQMTEILGAPARSCEVGRGRERKRKLWNSSLTHSLFHFIKKPRRADDSLMEVKRSSFSFGACEFSSGRPIPIKTLGKPRSS